MSGRHLNRLRGSRATELPADEDEVGPSESGEESESEGEAPPANPFDLLQGSDDEPVPDSNESGNESASPSPLPAPNPPLPPAPPKHRGRASRGRGGTRSAQRNKEDWKEVLTELTHLPAPPASSSRPGPPALPLVLRCSAEHLSAERELGRLFGAREVRESKREAAPLDFPGAPRRVRRMAARGAFGRRDALPSTLMISPKEHWPELRPGWLASKLSAGSVGKEGTSTLRLDCSHAYALASAEFVDCQARFDADALPEFLYRHPYHLEALLAMSERHRATGNHAEADDSLERCVYAIERAWPSHLPGVTPLGGGAGGRGKQGEGSAAAGSAAVPFRVPFDPDNRVVFEALGSFAQSLSRRGLHRTALEVGKLALQLDPADPTGVLFALDYYALRAGCPEYVLSLLERSPDGASLVLLPNWAFARALATRQMEQRQGSKRPMDAEAREAGEAGEAEEPFRWAGDAAVPSQSAGDAAVPSQSAGEAAVPSRSAASNSSTPPPQTLLPGDQLLMVAVVCYPDALTALVTRIAAANKQSEPSPDWQEVLRRPALRSNLAHASASREHAVELFVERSHQLWRLPELSSWLLRAARRVADLDPSTGVVAGAAPADWAAAAREVFAATEVHEDAFRHLRRAQFSDAVERLPAEELAAAAGAAGWGQDEVLEQLRAEMARLEARGGVADVGEEELREAQPLLMLLRTMLPWVNAGRAPEDGREEEEAE